MSTKRFTAMFFLALMLACPVLAQRGAGLVYHEVQVVDEFGRKVTDITSVSIYSPGTTTPQTVYMDMALSNAITLPMTTSSTNTTLASGAFYWWGQSDWDFTVTDGTNTHVNFGHNAMTPGMSRVVFPSYLQSISSTTYDDAQTATFGSGGDFVLQGGATENRFTVTPAATDESPIWWFGANTTGIDVEFFAGTSADYMLWDASDEALEFVGSQIHLDDDSDLQIGSDKDWTIESDTAKTLEFLPLAGDETYLFNIGSDAAGADFTLFAATSGDYVLWDASDDALEFVGTQVHLDDDSPLQLGSTAGDIVLQFNGTNFLIDASTASEGMLIGDITTGFDITYYFETAGEFRTDYNGDFINLTDDMDLRFGTGASADGDFQISSNSSNVLTFGQIVAGTGTIAFGVDDAGVDVTLFGDTASSQAKWDANGDTNGSLILTGASQTITGINSGGNLLTITGIDTTGNSDTVVIAHSGVGAAIQITSSEADTQLIELISAANQTTWLQVIDGAAGNWIGANDVGMLHLKADTALANAGAAQLLVSNTAQPITAAEGFLARFVDTGTARTNAYAIDVEVTDTTGGIYCDGHSTFTKGLQTGSQTVIATADGLTTGLIPDGASFVTVTSDTATKVVVLPTWVIGNVIRITVPATGAELQTLATSNDTINGVDCDGTNEMAMAAGSIYELVCVADSTWIAYGWSSAGAAQATIVPDADA